MHEILELYKSFHKVLILFPKHERHTLGQKIENTILETLEIILSASYTATYRDDFLRKANNKIDLLKYLIRLAYEIQSLRLKNYTALEESVIEIGKMIGGWRRFLK